MITEKIRSILAVIISIALFCGLLPMHAIPVYAGGGESDNTLGNPMVLKVQLADCSTSSNCLVSVWRQEDSASAKEEIGYYSTGDDEPYGSFSYIKGDILTVYVYDVPEELVQGSTLYYAWGYFPESFGKATDPYGYADCYAFTIDTRSVDITNIVNIFYNYSQVEYYQQNFSSDLQYCILSDESMFPVFVGPMDDGSYYYEDYSNQSAFLTSFNGWNKYFTWQSYEEVGYRIDSMDSIEQLSGLILDGTEYSIEALMDKNYVTIRNGYLVLKMSLLMPAMASIGKDDPRTLTIRPVISETESRYGEFLLDFHEEAGPDTYVEVIQTNSSGTVTAETAFSAADWDANGRCLVPYRIGEAIRIILHNVADPYKSSSFIFGNLLSEDGETEVLPFASADNGTFVLAPDAIDLSTLLSVDSCPTLSLYYSWNQLENHSMDRYLECNDNSDIYVLDVSDDFILARPDKQVTPTMAHFNGVTRFLIDTKMGPPRMDSVSVRFRDPELVDHLKLTIYGGSSYTGLNHYEEIEITLGSDDFWWVDFDAVNQCWDIYLEMLEEEYLKHFKGSFRGYYNCRIDVVYTEQAQAKYKLVLDVDNGALFRTSSGGVTETAGQESLVYDLYEKDLNQTLGNLISASGAYRQTLQVKSYEKAVLEGWQYQYDFQDDDESVPEEERQWFSFSVDDELYDLQSEMNKDLEVLFEQMGNPARENASVTKVHLKAIWHSEGPVIVNFVPMGHSFQVSCKHPENDFVFDQNLRWWFEANGMSLFRQEDVDTVSVRPVEEIGFLGWSLCRKVNAGSGSVSYVPLEEHLYSAEEIQSFIPTLEYGNELFFVAQWDMETKVQFVSAAIDDKIALNFYIALPDSADTLVLDGPEGEESVKVSALTPEESGLYKATYRLPAASMDEEIRLTLYGSDGGMIPLQNESAEEGAFSYSVRRYLLEAADAENLLTENLILAMNTYGLYVQHYFNLLAESELPKVDSIAENIWNTELETITGSLANGVQYYGSSLLLEDGIRLRHYFTGNPGTVRLGGKTAQVYTNGVFWYVETPALSIREIGDKNLYAVQVGTWRMYYSVLSYCAKAAVNHTAMEQVATALYHYYQAAVSYADCDHQDADYAYIGNGQHALLCPHCGYIWDAEDCDIWMGTCMSCLAEEDTAAFSGMKILCSTPQGKAIDSSVRDHVYEGDLVTVSEEWNYPENADVTDWEAALYLTFPTGERVDLLSEDTDLVEVVSYSVKSSADGKKGTASLTFYASQELPGTTLQFEVKGIRKAFGGNAGTENRVLVTLRSEEKKCSVKDALIMGILENLPETLSVSEGQTGQKLTVRGYGPGSVTYQWQSYDSISGRWVNIAGANSSTYLLSQIRSDLDGKKIRCIIQNDTVVLLSKECTITLS